MEGKCWGILKGRVDDTHIENDRPDVRDGHTSNPGNKTKALV